MALSKSMSLPNGVSVSYHRIQILEMSRETNNVTVTIASFIDQASRQAGKSPVSLSSQTLSDIDISQPMLQQCYAKLKQEGNLSGASDI